MVLKRIDCIFISISNYKKQEICSFDKIMQTYIIYNKK